MVKPVVISFLVLALIVISSDRKAQEDGGVLIGGVEASEKKIELPWKFGGYTEVEELHLQYHYVFGEAIEKVLSGEMSWEDSIKDNTGIVEVWFKSDGSHLRLDRYIEKLGVICESYEGAPPETISHNGKTYSLYERVIQEGRQRTHYGFSYRAQTGYDEETQQAIGEGCHYETSTFQASKKPDPQSAITSMMAGHTSLAGFSFYSSNSSDARELLASGLELDKFMDPSGYERTVEGWKIKEKIAGRDAVKHNISPISARFGLAKGFQFIDTELGIGLAGYLEGCAKSLTHKETKFEQPKLVFHALLVETTVSGDLFESF